MSGSLAVALIDRARLKRYQLQLFLLITTVPHIQTMDGSISLD